jgi:antitoxin (DNA-binding transcriptional repressor) of toxin-antitoxin stability system
MIQTIGLADAKARFSEIVDRVEAGETVVISRNGDPIVEMRPLHRLSAAEAVEKIRAIGKRVAKRNAGKPAWPPEGESLRNVAHNRHRF